MTFCPASLSSITKARPSPLFVSATRRKAKLYTHWKYQSAYIVCLTIELAFPMVVARTIQIAIIRILLPTPATYLEDYVSIGFRMRMHLPYHVYPTLWL